WRAGRGPAVRRLRAGLHRGADGGRAGRLDRAQAGALGRPVGAGPDVRLAARDGPRGLHRLRVAVAAGTDRTPARSLVAGVAGGAAVRARSAVDECLVARLGG